MMRFVLCSIPTFVLLCAPAIADDPSHQAGNCPVSEKVSKLLESWKEAVDATKTQAPAEREKIHERLISLVRECPVGSRIAPTLVLGRDVLAAVKACGEANSKSCPFANATAEQKASESFASGMAMATAYGKLLNDLHQLLTYTVDCNSCAPGSACCSAGAAVAKAGAPASTPEGTKAPACEAGAACGKELAVRAITLSKTWSTVGEDLARLPAAKRQELHEAFQSMSGSCKAVALMPSTILALSEGFDALDTIQGKMCEWAKANPAYLQSIPEEAKLAFELNGALIHQVREDLRCAARIFEAAKSHADGAPVQETASRDK